MGASRRKGRRNENFACQYLRYVTGSLTCRWILWHVPSVFTSHQNGGVLRIFFIALKNPSPWPGLNPRPLGPVASTLTTTPPRRPDSSTGNKSDKSPHEQKSIRKQVLWSVSWRILQRVEVAFCLSLQRRKWTEKLC
jgi:hypothetical protein